ncbi:MAG: hypothetical protein O9313_16970, partial [Acetobacteraceae bacterium]|nr:hypothetical protein [Acetobacteraceae bacterium]
ITLTNYFSANPKQPSTKPQNPKQIPPKEHPPRRRPRIPPRHSSQQGTTHSNKAQHPTIQRQPSTINFQKKPDAIVKQQKKNQQQNALRHPTSPAPSTTPIIGRAKTLANTNQPVKP